MTWAKLDQVESRPRLREDHTWTVDPTAHVGYVFGGRDGNRSFDDLWAFDLATDTWEALEPDGDRPPARFGHEAAWVDGVGLVVFAGQADASTFFNDLWAYDAEAGQWSELPSDGAVPIPRYGTCSRVDPGGRLWISHGFTEDRARFADTRVYDFEAGTWEDVTPEGPLPVERCLHGCWWTPTGSLALYAGQTTGVEALGDLWLLEGAGSSVAKWSESAVALPPERNLYAYAAVGDDILVFGGRGDGRFRDDLWRFLDGLSPEAVEVEGGPPPGRSGATLIDDPLGGRLLLFGGKNGDGALGDLWALEPG